MYLYKTNGTCSKQVTFEVDLNNKISNISYEGGCEGNLIVLSKLLEGMDIDEVIEKIEGIKCSNRNTSCPDQLAKALKIYKKQVGPKAAETSFD